MSWLNRYKREWRVIELVLLLVAMMGPWAFDLISVPAQYPCTPAVRLDGDFCGIPMPGTWILSMAVLVPVNGVVELITGTAALADRTRELTFSLLLLLLVLPFISALLMILGRHHSRWQVLHMITLGLAASFALYISTLGFSRWGYRELWGIWFYIGVTTSALVLEVLTFNSEKETQLGIQHSG